MSQLSAAVPMQSNIIPITKTNNVTDNKIKLFKLPSRFAITLKIAANINVSINAYEVFNCRFSYRVYTTV